MKSRGLRWERLKIWGLIIAILMMIPASYAPGSAPCASLWPERATGAEDLHPETPVPSSDCDSGTHAGAGFTASCTACGATLPPSGLVPLAVTLEVHWSPPASPTFALNLPSLPWRPPA
jgi:hypothetical protein